jgi:hypothetical protein
VLAQLRDAAQDPVECGLAPQVDALGVQRGMRTRPVLVFDGDCAFCTTSVRLAERWLRPNCDITPWQRADLPWLGVDQPRAEYEVTWVTPGGLSYGGAQAVAKLLLGWRRLGLPGGSAAPAARSLDRPRGLPASPRTTANGCPAGHRRARSTPLADYLSPCETIIFLLFSCRRRAFSVRRIVQTAALRAVGILKAVQFSRVILRARRWEFLALGNGRCDQRICQCDRSIRRSFRSSAVQIAVSPFLRLCPPLSQS